MIKQCTPFKDTECQNCDYKNDCTKRTRQISKKAFCNDFTKPYLKDNDKCINCSDFNECIVTAYPNALFPKDDRNDKTD